MGHSVIVTAFIVTIVGGLGSLGGAVTAAVLYGFVHTFVTTFSDGVIADIVGLLLMLLVLVARPTGHARGPGPGLRAGRARSGAGPAEAGRGVRW